MTPPIGLIPWDRALAPIDERVLKVYWHLTGASVHEHIEQDLRELSEQFERLFPHYNLRTHYQATDAGRDYTVGVARAYVAAHAHGSGAFDSMKPLGKRDAAREASTKSLARTIGVLQVVHIIVMVLGLSGCFVLLGLWRGHASTRAGVGVFLLTGLMLATHFGVKRHGVVAKLGDLGTFEYLCRVRSPSDELPVPQEHNNIEERERLALAASRT